VVALGDGYWRWAFRGEQARATYRRLWAALAGWLARDATVADEEVVSPVRRVVPRGDAVAWRAPGHGEDSLRISVSDAAGATVLDTLLELGGDGTVETAVLPPGHYTYRASVNGQNAGGPFTVEPFAAEWVRPAVALEDLAPAGAALGDARAGTVRGRPVRASPWPWLVLVLLLALEWTLRRRWGLR
jgi:hypothetical protein